MTAPDEKAREIADEIAAEYNISRYGRSRIAGAITAVLIEARRAALEDAGKWLLKQYGKQVDIVMPTTMQRALIPTRPDGAADGK
jgi:hypothetical protein